MDESGYPRAIVHFDGDAFFAAVEQAVHPHLKGRPLVTGLERGIIACASYEAKALGIKRGVSLWDARRMCRDLVVLPSDYETYSLFSKRMFEIARRFTPLVEEYSIDEGFADLTGLRRLFRCGYEEIAQSIQTAVREELDITVSVGLSLSKSLAKLASKYRKPKGLTAVPGEKIPEFLQDRKLSDVWGFGPNTVALLTARGLKTPWDFTRQPELRAGQLLGKIGREIWNELRGVAVYPVETEARTPPATICKCKTFTSPSADPDFVYAKLVRNVESAFIKLRRHRLRTGLISVSLRRQDYGQRGFEVRLSRSAAAAQEVLPVVREIFERLIESGAIYRATMIALGEMESDRTDQLDLFEDRIRADRFRVAARVTDEVNARFGKHKVASGQALFLARHPHTERDEVPERRNRLLPGETARRRLALPMLDMKI
ncbi:MAG: DNA polymerase IV [Kiritimatiellia bacterium]|nr:DNA polymerase IV [Kiritimatiellia bacterium]